MPEESVAIHWLIREFGLLDFERLEHTLPAIDREPVGHDISPHTLRAETRYHQLSGHQSDFGKICCNRGISMTVNLFAKKTRGVASTKSKSKLNTGDAFQSLPIPELQAKSGYSPDSLIQSRADKWQARYGPDEIEEKKANPVLNFLTYWGGPIPWMIQSAVNEIKQQNGKVRIVVSDHGDGFTPRPYCRVVNDGYIFLFSIEELFKTLNCRFTMTSILGRGSPALLLIPLWDEGLNKLRVVIKSLLAQIAPCERIGAQ